MSEVISQGWDLVNRIRNSRWPRFGQTFEREESICLHDKSILKPLDFAMGGDGFLLEGRTILVHSGIVDYYGQWSFDDFGRCNWAVLTMRDGQNPDRFFVGDQVQTLVSYCISHMVMSRVFDRRYGFADMRNLGKRPDIPIKPGWYSQAMDRLEHERNRVRSVTSAALAAFEWANSDHRELRPVGLEWGGRNLESGFWPIDPVKQQA